MNRPGVMSMALSAMVASLLVAVSTARAQDAATPTKAATAAKCAVSFDPAAISASDQPITVAADPSTPIGNVSSVTADENSGLVIVKADAATNEKEATPAMTEASQKATDQAAGAEKTEEKMANEPSAKLAKEHGTVAITLDATNAAIGDWNVALKGDKGSCDGTLTVKAAEESSTDQSQ